MEDLMNYGEDNISNNEEWRDVVGYEGLYMVSNTGRVKSLFRYKMILNPTIDNGYAFVGLYKNKKCKKTPVHVIVARAFIPNPYSKPQVNHINPKRDFNNVENLEWCTPSENAIHAVKHNLTIPPTGEKNGMSKLKEEDVLLIRKKRNESKLSRKQLAEMFKVSIKHIDRVRSKKRWGHI